MHRIVVLILAGVLCLCPAVAFAASGFTTVTIQDGGGASRAVNVNSSTGAVTGNLSWLNTICDFTIITQCASVTAGNALKVDGSAVTQPVSGTFWQATQPVSGTFWQATQPVSAASLPLPTGASTAALQPTNAAQGSTTSGQTGLLGLCAATTSAPTYTTTQTNPLSCDTSGNLRVSASLAWANTNKTIIWDGTTNITVEAASTAAAQTDTALVERNPDVGTIGDTAWTSGNGTAIAVLKAIAGNTGAAIPTQAPTVTIGGVSNDACNQLAKLGAPINLTASGQVITGTSGKKTYICSIDLISATAQNIALVEGTGSTCATNIYGLAGGTTAATGWNLSANGGLTKGAGIGTVYSPSGDTNATAANVCLLPSSTGQISGQITYVQQ